MKTVTFERIEVEPYYEFHTYPGAELLGLVMHGNEPWVVIEQEHPPAKFSADGPCHLERVTLRLVRACDDVPLLGTYVGSFWAKIFYAVYRV